jgi:hypothetical protein
MRREFLYYCAFRMAEVHCPLGASETVSAGFPQFGDPETDAVHAFQQIWTPCVWLTPGGNWLQWKTILL